MNDRAENAALKLAHDLATELPSAGVDEAVSSAVVQRIDGTFEVDTWGFDPHLNNAARWLAARRWNISVAHGKRIPDTGPALLIVNRRLGLSEMGVLTAGLAAETSRDVRVADLVDVPFLAPTQRRFGSVLRHPDEIAGLLRAGHVVALPMGRAPLRRRGVGSLAVELIEPAVALGVPILPVALRGHELRRKWNITVGRPMRAKLTADPSAVATLAQRARSAVEDML